YPDGTRLELAPNSTLRFPADGALRAGKRLFLTGGFVTADVAPQAEGQPLVLTTPHAEITAAVTRFSVQSGPSSTSLELEAGPAQFTRKSDGKTIDVASGSYVVAGAEAMFAPQVLPPRTTQHRLALIEGSGPVLNIALAPDGKTLASGGWDGTIR